MSEALCQCGHAQMSHFGIVGQGSCQINVGRSRCQCVKYAPPTREPIRLTDEERALLRGHGEKWAEDAQLGDLFAEPVESILAARLTGGPTLADAWEEGRVYGIAEAEQMTVPRLGNPYRTPESETTDGD